MTSRWRALADADYPYLVATRQGSVVGYCYAGPHHSRPGYRHTVDCSVYVSPQARRQGVGSELLGALIPACSARSFRQIIAVIGESDNTASVSLHARHGFSHVGMLKFVGFKHGRWLDVVLMQKELPTGRRPA